MKKTYVCIICPNGCEIETETNGEKLLAAQGALCAKGEEYVERELFNPQRNIATSVLVENGTLPLVSVRLSQPIPKNKIFAVMREIQAVRLQAPVKMGQIVLEDVLNLKSDVLSTKNVAENT